PGELEPTGLRIEQPPVASNRALEPLLPWLIERLDDVDVEILAAGDGKNVLDDPRLICRRRQRAVPHATRARPTNLADENLLGGECSRNPAANGVHVGGRLLGGN